MKKNKTAFQRIFYLLLILTIGLLLLPAEQNFSNSQLKSSYPGPNNFDPPTKKNTILQQSVGTTSRDRINGKSKVEIMQEQWQHLASKALLSHSERKKKIQLLEDPQLIHHQVAILSSTGTHFSPDSEKSRILSVRYLEQSLDHLKHPQMPQLLQLVQNFLKTPWAEKNIDDRLKKSLAGDRYQLFKKLVEKHPYQALQITQANLDPKLHQIYRQVYQSLWYGAGNLEEAS